MVTELNYLVLSGLSYGDFRKEDIGKKLEDILFSNNSSKKRLMNFPNEVWAYGGSDIFEKTFHKFLSEWKVIDIMDDTHRTGKNKTGFYAIAFEKEGQIVISYRGTELGSFGEAYKDFIETDLLIGMDKKPKQLDQGVEFYLKMMKFKHESIALTGHSLGGGIAQYVALISDLKDLGIPMVYTWNALGINKVGIVNIEDFIDFDKIIENKYPELKKSSNLYKKLRNYYYDQLTKVLKKNNYIKDKESIKKISKSDFKLELEEESIKKFDELITQNSKIEKNKNALAYLNQEIARKKENLLLGLTKDDGKNQLVKQEKSKKYELTISTKKFIKDCFDEHEIYHSLLAARNFMRKFKRNNRYNDFIINFIHTEDFTVTLYNHLGSTYAINKGLVRVENKLHPLLKKMFAFTKSIRSYHMYQVFLPFFDLDNEEKRGYIGKELSKVYIATEVRKVIYQEKNLPDELLGFYYERKNLTEKNYYKIKKSLVQGMDSSKANIKYLKEAVVIIKRMDFEEFSNLWEIVIKKIGSPFIKKDIYDLIIFDERHK